jgi:hypothetical protein
VLANRFAELVRALGGTMVPKPLVALGARLPPPPATAVSPSPGDVAVAPPPPGDVAVARAALARYLADDLLVLWMLLWAQMDMNEASPTIEAQRATLAADGRFVHPTVAWVEEPAALAALPHVPLAAVCDSGSAFTASRVPPPAAVRIIGSVCRMLMDALCCREAMPHSVCRTIGRRANDCFHGRARDGGAAFIGDAPLAALLATGRSLLARAGGVPVPAASGNVAETNAAALQPDGAVNASERGPGRHRDVSHLGGRGNAPAADRAPTRARGAK